MKLIMKKTIFIESGKFFKGNLHCHSTLSDGSFTPLEHAIAYKEHGYSFLAMTDHNRFDSHSEIMLDDFVMLPGNERNIYVNGSNQCWHFVGISDTQLDTQTNYRTKHYELQEKPPQAMINSMRDSSNFVILAHPIWSRMHVNDLLELDNIIGVEVFNSTCEVHNRTGYADTYWDIMLREGKKVFGFATDDTHLKSAADRCHGWICVKAKSLSQQSIIDGIIAGQFYSSNGPEIHEITFDSDTLEVEVSCSDCSAIHFVSYEPRGKSYYANDGESINMASHKLDGSEIYVRVECVDMYGHIAWSNPIYIAS